MSEGEKKETAEQIDSFRLYHPMDRAALVGVDKAAMAEKMLTKRKEAREQFTGKDESRVKNAFTGTAAIFKKPSGELYAVVHTDWVDEEGKTDPEVTSWSIKVPISKQQLRTMQEAREVHK